MIRLPSISSIYTNQWINGLVDSYKCPMFVHFLHSNCQLTGPMPPPMHLLAVHEDTWHGAGPGDAQKNVLHLVELAFHNYGSHITAPPPKKLAFTMAFTMEFILPHLLQKKMEQWSDFKQLFHC